MLKMREFAERFVPALVDKIEYYTGERPIFDIYSVESPERKAQWVHAKPARGYTRDESDLPQGAFVESLFRHGHDQTLETMLELFDAAIITTTHQIAIRQHS